MTLNGEPVTFTYDASGKPETMTYLGETYYYVTNLQGDVVSITDSSGTWLVHYYYTAYGSASASQNADHAALSATLISANPLTYRGYVYDQGIGLYYLQSRYYNPNTGRFLNADALVSTGQGMLGNNMFAYCNNNPVACYDPNGNVLLPIPSLADFYMAHKLVQCDVVYTEGYAMEVYVLSILGKGYLDLYDPVSNQYYEVKHYLQEDTKHTRDQMNRYNSSYVFSWMFEGYTFAGSPFPGTRIDIKGNVEYKYWDVYYEANGKGVITYRFVLDKKRYFEHLEVVQTIVVVAAAAGVLGYLSGSISAPHREVQIADE